MVAPNAVAALCAADAMLVTPKSVDLAFTMLLTEMVSPLLAPTWKVLFVKLPSNSLTPLKLVCVATRLISLFSCCASASSAERSEALLVALADCTASSTYTVQ